MAEDAEGLGSAIGTGIWRDLQPVDTTGLLSGTDGSGGPLSANKMLRLCDWAAVAHHVVGTLRGPVPGSTQTVPLAEAYAMSMIFRLTQGPLSFCSDSLACVKRIRKLRPQSQFVVGKRSNSEF